MDSIVIDVTNKKGITAVVIVSKGMVVDKRVFTSKYENQYENLIEGYTVGIPLLRSYLESNLEFNGKVLFVASASALVTWLNRKCALPKYSEKFSNLLDLIEALPVEQIEYIRSDNLVSTKFATKTQITTKELHSLDVLM